MQRDEEKITKVTVRENWPTSITSRLNGANIGAVVFNTDYIAQRNPELVVEILALYEEARRTRDTDVLDRNDERFTSSALSLFTKGILTK